MNLISGVCSLCHMNDKILPAFDAQYYLDLVKTTFFQNYEDEEEQFSSQICNISLCTLCAYKVEASSVFKTSFEEFMHREFSFKKTLSECFMCCTKDQKLVKTDGDPNFFCSRMKIFMDAVLTPRPFKQCAVCLYCLFHFNIWFGVRTAVFDMLQNQPFDHGVTNGVTRKASRTTKEKENVPLPKKMKSVKVRANSTPKDSDKEAGSDNQIKKMIAMNRLVSAQKSYSGKLDVDDDKLLKDIPYVAVYKSNKLTANKTEDVSRRRSRNKAVITELNTSTDSVVSQVKEPLRASSKTAPDTVKRNVKATPNTPRKSSTFFKIKGSTGFVKASRAKTATDLKCKSCSTKVKTAWELKAHMLKHEKPDILVVNITRYNLPTKINASEFIKKFDQKKKYSLTTIKGLVGKYLGNSAAEVFEESSSEQDVKESVDKAVELLETEEALDEPMEVSETQEETENVEKGEVEDTRESAEDPEAKTDNQETETEQNDAEDSVSNEAKSPDDSHESETEKKPENDVDDVIIEEQSENTESEEKANEDETHPVEKAEDENINAAKQTEEASEDEKDIENSESPSEQASSKEASQDDSLELFNASLSETVEEVVTETECRPEDSAQNGQSAEQQGCSENGEDHAEGGNRNSMCEESDTEDISKICRFLNSNLDTPEPEPSKRKRGNSLESDNAVQCDTVTPVKKKVRFACDTI